jgi:hypothetical protein
MYLKIIPEAGVACFGKEFWRSLLLVATHAGTQEKERSIGNYEISASAAYFHLILRG